MGPVAEAQSLAGPSAVHRVTSVSYTAARPRRPVAAASATFTGAPVAGVSTPVNERFWRKYSAAVCGVVSAAPPT